MAEKRGVIVNYNTTNRQGRIRPEDGGPEAMFYLPNVANAEPLPREGDKVVFDAPPPRKNKKGKVIQENASSVTIDERAPELTPEQLARIARQKADAERRVYSNDPRPSKGGKGRGRDGKGGGRGDRRGGDDRRGSGGFRRDAGAPGGSGPGRDGAGRSGPGREGFRKEGEAAGPRRDGQRRAGPGRDGERRFDRRDGKPGAPRRSDGKPGDRKGRQQTKPQDRIKVPWGRDLPASAVHLDYSNPSLVLEKFVQWPKEQLPREQLPQQPRPRREERVRPPRREAPPTALAVALQAAAGAAAEPVAPEVAVAEAQPVTEIAAPVETVAAEAPLAPTDLTAEATPPQDAQAQQPKGKPEPSVWKLLPKHKRYFLTRTLAQLYRNYERKTLPWTAVRARREQMLRSIEQSGYTVASELVRGPWRFAVDGLAPNILGDAPLSFDRIFGHPSIPAANLRRLLERFVAQHAELTPELAALEQDCIILDAVPSTKVGQFTIEEVPCRYPIWSTDGITEDKGISRTAFALCSGVDSAFLITVAVKDSSPERKAAKALLFALVSAIRSANSTFAIEGAEKPTPVQAMAVLY